MPPKSKKTKSETQKGKKSAGSAQETAPEDQAPVLKCGLAVVVEAVQNVEVFWWGIVRLELEGEVVAKSEPFSLEDPLLQVRVEHIFPTVDLDTVARLVDTPYIVSLYVLPPGKTNAKASKGSKSSLASRESKMGKEDSKTSTSSKKSGRNEDGRFVGQAPLDILPILMGERTLNETLILESAEKEEEGVPQVPAAEKPSLWVTVTGVDYCFIDLQQPLANVLNIAIESVYNDMPVPPPKGGMVNALKAATVLPARTPSQEIQITELKDFETLKFEYSTLESEPVPENRKKWNNLGHIQGRSAFTKYKIPDRIVEIKDTVGVNLNKVLEHKKQRVQFNCISRRWLSADVETSLYNSLIKYNCWPLEFVLNPIPGGKRDKGSRPSSKASSKGSSRSSSPGSSSRSSPRNLAAESTRFVAFLDLSNLLYPGVTHTRITSRLWTYNRKTVEERTGIRGPFFPDEPAEQGKGSGKKNKAVKKSAATDKSSVKSKPTTKAGSEATQKSQKSKGGQSAVRFPTDDGKLGEAEEEEEEPEAVAVRSPQGEPVFVIVEVELLKPFVRQKTHEELSQTIEDYISPPLPLSHGQSKMRKAVEMFRLCIENLAGYIDTKYQEFVQAGGADKLEPYEFDTLESRFMDFVRESGAYGVVQETMKDKLVTYLRDAVGTPQQGCSPQEFECTRVSPNSNTFRRCTSNW